MCFTCKYHQAPSPHNEDGVYAPVMGVSILCMTIQAEERPMPREAEEVITPIQQVWMIGVERDGHTVWQRCL